MKLAVLSIISFTTLVLNTCEAQELPASAQALKKAYEQAVERATTPLTTKYLAELDRLKQQAARMSDALAIAAITAEIETVKANTVRSLDSAMAFRDRLLQGLWVGTEKNLNKWTVKLLPSGGIDMTRPDGSPGFTGWSWHIDDRNDLHIAITGAKPEKVELSKRVDKIQFSWGTLIRQK